VARLIQQLGSNRYLDRHEADRQLSKIGPDFRKQLEDAALSDDPEIRLRARTLLEKLKVNQLWAPGAVHFDAKGVPASKTLAALAVQTGNHILVGDQFGPFAEKPLELSFPQTTYWQAVDEVCRATGNHVRPHYDTRTPGIVVTSGAAGKQPVAYAGPLRAQITSARRVFIEQVDFENMKSELTHTFQLDLQMMWEDQFRLLAYAAAPELAESRTDTGVRVVAAQPSVSGWNVVAPGTRQLTASVRLSPPPLAAKKLSTFALKWNLVAVGDMATIEVEDPQPKSQFHQDDVTLTIESFSKQTAARYEVALVVSRDIAMPEPQEILFHENDVELLDKTGRPMRQQSQSNLLTERGVELKTTFVGETSESAPHKLRFSYPRLRARRDMEIIFRDVPLPASRPE
jgi:hypothetical protein